MKNYSKIKTLAVIALCFCNLLKSQVSIVNNLTPNLAQNTDLILEVKISKGAIANFSKFQIDVPAGVTVTEGDSKTGNFTFENNRAKIVWVSIPAEPEFVVSMKMNTGAVSGSHQLFQKFYYLDNGVKKEVEVDAVTVNFTADGSKSLASLGGQVTNNNSSAAAANAVINSTAITAASTNSTQVVSSTPTETPSATTNNNNVAGTPATTVNSTTSSPPDTKMNATTSSNNNSNSYNQNTSNTSTTVKNSNASETKPVTSDGLNYRIQLGAFSISPEKSRFKTAGTIDVLNEGGMYKAMLGNFNSKDEAFKKLASLKTLGYDGIVISYQNGQRVGLVRQ